MLNIIDCFIVDRLTRDLTARTPPNMRLKMITAQTPSERRLVGKEVGSVGIGHTESKIGTRVRTLQHPSLKLEKEV